MRAKTYLSVFTIGLGTLSSSLDSAVNIAFPAITAAFAIELPTIQWVVICYVLTYASLMLVFGKLGDMLGYERIFRIGLWSSALALTLCAAAPTFGWFLFFRVLQGVGSALVLSCGPALVTTRFPEAMRGRALGTYMFMFALGGVLGPSLGGVLVQLFGWSAVYWFRVPIALAAWAMFRGEAPPAPAAGGLERKAFDAPGAMLLVLALTALLLALNRAQHTDGHPALALALGLLALGATVAFTRRELRAANPIVEPRHFRNLDFSFVTAASCLVNLVGFAVMLLVPYYLLRSGALPAGTAGLVLASMPLGSILASPVAGRLLEHQPAQRIGFAGAAMLGIGLLWIGSWQGATPIAWMVPALVLHGFGLGLFQVSYLDMAAATLPREDRGVAGSLAMLTRTIGTTVAASTLSFVFQTVEQSQLAAGVGAAESFTAAFRSTFTAIGVVPLALVAIAVVRFGRARR